jgi:hypothetical protein
MNVNLIFSNEYCLDNIWLTARFFIRVRAEPGNLQESIIRKTLTNMQMIGLGSIAPSTPILSSNPDAWIAV